MQFGRGRFPIIVMTPTAYLLTVSDSSLQTVVTLLMETVSDRLPLV